MGQKPTPCGMCDPASLETDQLKRRKGPVFRLPKQPSRPAPHSISHLSVNETPAPQAQPLEPPLLPKVRGYLADFPESPSAAKLEAINLRNQMRLCVRLWHDRTHPPDFQGTSTSMRHTPRKLRRYTRQHTTSPSKSLPWSVALHSG